MVNGSKLVIQANHKITYSSIPEVCRLLTLSSPCLLCGPVETASDKFSLVISSMEDRDSERREQENGEWGRKGDRDKGRTWGRREGE